ncbi:MAG: TIGR01212 family radical SAM protein, partial [Clostridia bacterium]|nr:TIGR01212 family radical SAM protein [Clostridia bacterium]
MKIKQKDINPFVNSDSNKRYYTYDYYLKKTFGGKCMKIPLDAGFTCPNIDGRCSVGGCIYCSPRGSGDFAAESVIPVSEQFEIVKNQLSSKWKTDKYIPYFQAHTNTYAPLCVIREKVESVMGKEGVVALNIATRADCLENDVVAYLGELAERTVLTVELGLQTVHDGIALAINRGHTYADFLEGYNKLRAASDKINICI